MFQKKAKDVSANTIPLYATHRDFCRIFTEDKTALYLLSLLLTADAQKAERCFVAGLEDSVLGNKVFREWARSWSKRTIIKNAIRAIAPVPGQLATALHDPVSAAIGANLDPSLTAVLELAPFQRFVFVMSVLEKYSIADCSTLLNCAKQDVITAQKQALLALAGTGLATPSVASKAGFDLAHFLEPARAA